jgi:hypothetical protein
MKVKSKQYSGRSSNSAMASALSPQVSFHCSGPAQTFFARVVRVPMVSWDDEVDDEVGRRGLIRSVK